MTRRRLHRVIIEEAFVNLGGKYKVFQLNEHALTLQMLGNFHMATWSSMFDNLMTRHALAAYSSGVDSFLNDLYVYKDAHHPVKGIIPCFLFHTPQLLMRHAMAMANQETKVTLFDFRLFGSKDFQGIWEQWLARENLPMSQAECAQLYYVSNTFTTGNLIRDSFMNDLINNWEDEDAEDIIMIPDPQDYAPEDYSTPERPSAKETTAPSSDNSDEQQGDKNAQAGDQTTSSNKPSGNDTEVGNIQSKGAPTIPARAPDLAFPREAPANGRTHLHGYWVARDTPEGVTKVWCDYMPYITYAQLPNNFVWEHDHWVGRLFPGGKAAYAGLNSDGTRRFVYDGEEEFEHMFPTPVKPIPSTSIESTTSKPHTPTTDDKPQGTQMRHWTESPNVGSGLKQSNPGRISWGPSVPQPPQTQTGGSTAPTPV